MPLDLLERGCLQNMITARDLIHISVRQVFRQRRRSFGVMLAIALGTASLLAVMAMGDEVKKKLNHDLDLLGGATLSSWD